MSNVLLTVNISVLKGTVTGYILFFYYVHSVRALENILPIVNTNLHKNRNGNKEWLVFVKVIPVCLLQHTEILQPTINSLVALARNCLRNLLSYCTVHIGQANTFLTTVTFVCFNFLPFRQEILQTWAENLDIWPPPTREWTMDPNNIPRLNANSNLVPQSSRFKFVGKPLLGKVCWVFNLKICPVNRYLAFMVFIGAL